MKKIILLMLLLCGCVSAEFIGLTTRAETDKVLFDTESGINVSIRNYGDEGAFDVSVKLVSVDGIESSELFLGNIQPNETVNGILNITLPEDVKPGSYTSGMFVYYYDKDKVQFSFISPVSFSYLQRLRSNVVGRLTQLKLEHNNIMPLEVQNRGGEPKQLLIRFYVPDTLAVKNGEKTLHIAGMDKEDLSFDVTNFGASGGANYFVFATIDYVVDGLHYSSLASGGRILIEDSKGPWFNLWGVILVILGGIVVFDYLKNRFREVE